MTSGHNTTPHPYPTLALLQRPIAVLSAALSLRYLWWRTAHTLNYESTTHLAVSLALLAAEIYGFVSIALFYLHSPDDPAPQAPSVPEASLPSVDVFVPIYNEPVEILYKTLVGAKGLDYPKRLVNVYVLDDGPREAVRQTAESLGCRYLSRPDRKHAKAGNINNALAHSQGELVVILDCDHVPVRSFLRESVGFFQDPKTAFVQMPHHFYNPDTFQQNLALEGHIGHEQDLFFHVVLPGRQRSNAVMFCGSSAVLRRSAIEEIGGIRTATAIEDTHTSMHLLARGYRGIYQPKVLSGALSPESFGGYLRQRTRWTRGGVQIFVLDNPLLLPGLSVMQRLHYFASTLFFFHGMARLVFLMAPLTFLTFSLNPIVADTLALLGYFVPHYVFGHLLLMGMSREHRSPFWSDVYEATASFHLSWTALATLLNPNQLIFNVTPKGEKLDNQGRVSWAFVLPHVAVLTLIVAGLVIATRRFVATGLHLDAFLISAFWSGYNVVLLACAVEAARERVRVRKHHRLPRRILCQLMFEKGAAAGETVDISESGASVRLAERWYLPRRCRIRLVSDYGETTEVEAAVARKDWPEDGGTRVGLEFLNVGEEARQGIVRQMFSSVASWSGIKRPPAAHSFKALWQILTSAVRHRFRGRTRPTRSWPRIFVRLPCEVELSEGLRVPGVIQDVSATGAGIALSALSSKASEISLHFAMNGTSSAVKCQIVRRVERKDGVVCTVRFRAPDHVDISPLVPKDYASVA